MKVYIVGYGYDYEGTNIVAVVTSKEQAENIKNRIAVARSAYNAATTIRPPNMYSFGDYSYIEEWELDDLSQYNLKSLLENSTSDSQS